METCQAIQSQQPEPKAWPKVAIIILNYNGWKDTIECLESVLRNDYPNYQIIVVDNGSPNNSMEHIKAWAEGRQEVLTPEPSHPLYHLSHPPVKKPIPYIYYTREEAEKGGDFELEEKLTKEWQEQRNFSNIGLIPTSPYPLIFIQTGENLGFAGGNNVGIIFALKREVEYIFLLNNDAIVEPRTLSYLFKTAQNYPQIGIVGSLIRSWNGGNIQSCGVMHHWAYGPKELKQVYKKNQPFECDAVNGSAMLISARVFSRVGLLDEKFFLYHEETDFCYSVRKAGYSIFCEPRAVVYHKLSASTGGKDSPLCIYYGSRNILLLFRKHFSWVEFACAALRYGIVGLVRFIWWTVRGKRELAMARLQGYCDYWRGRFGRRDFGFRKE